MKAKKILDDSLKQDGFFSQESVMPQYTSCFKAVKKALTTSLTDTEEKMYSREEVEVLCRNAHLLGMKETLPGYPKPETIDEWIKENL